jgi:hypothetical protein
MAKSNTARNTQSAVVKFDLAAWSEALAAAALNVESGAKQLLDLALAARGKVEADTAREKFGDAFAAAMAKTHNVTDDEARASKSFKNRVSDAMAVFKCEKLPASLPSNLQRAADAVRKANPSSRKPRAGGKAPKEDNVVSVGPLGMLELALAQLKVKCGDNATALEIVAELTDLATDLADVLAAETADSSEAQAA